MVEIVLFAYGLYFILIGVNGNGPAFLSEISQEKQFAYWIVALFIIALLWESKTLTGLAKPFVALVVIGFLLKSNNYQLILNGFRNALNGSKP